MLNTTEGSEAVLTKNMGGFDYSDLQPKEMRGGRRTLLAGSCTQSIQHKKAIIVDDLAFLKTETDKPVKMTLPGPMTVVDSTNNNFYATEQDMATGFIKEENKWQTALFKEKRLTDDPRLDSLN